MKAIIVKYHGPTNSRGTRYSASDADKNRISVPIDHALNEETNRDAAALALCKKMHWTGTLIRGSIGRDAVYVWLNDSAVLNTTPEIR